MTSPSPRGEYHQSLINRNAEIRERLMGSVTSKSFKASLPGDTKTQAEMDEEQALAAILPLVSRDFIDVGSVSVTASDDERPSAQAIIQGVARRHGVTAAMIKGPRRSVHIVAARHEAMYIVTQLYPDWSIPRVGRLFNRDHSTVLYAVRMYRERHSQ